MNSGILIPEFMSLTTIYTTSLSGKKVLGVTLKVFLQFNKTNIFFLPSKNFFLNLRQEVTNNTTQKVKHIFLGVFFFIY